MLDYAALPSSSSRVMNIEQKNKRVYAIREMTDEWNILLLR